MVSVGVMMNKKLPLVRNEISRGKFSKPEGEKTFHDNVCETKTSSKHDIKRKLMYKHFHALIQFRTHIRTLIASHFHDAPPANVIPIHAH